MANFLLWPKDFVNILLFILIFSTTKKLVLLRFPGSIINDHCFSNNWAGIPRPSRTGVFMGTWIFLHCPKSNPHFRHITWNVVENMTLHELFRVVSRFPRYISCYLAENWFPLGQCRVGWSDIRFFPELGLEASRDRKIFWQQHVITKQMFHWIKTRESVAHQSCSFVELHRKLSFNYFFFFPWFFGRKYPIEDSTNC